MKQPKTKTIILTGILAVIFLIIVGLGIFVKKVLSPAFNIQETTYIYITEEKDYDKLLNDLQDSAKIKHLSTFKKVASFLDYPTQMKTGRYAITPTTTIKDLIAALRSGLQAPIKIKFNNIRTKDDFAIRISNQLMPTKEQILSSLNDSSLCSELGFTPESIVAMFIPNTYEFYWDTDTQTFLKRMKKEYDRFWNSERLAKAKQLNLTPDQISTLASIVEEECYFQDEYPIVAGLYLNRLRRGQKLEADPTVKFAIGDFSVRRILSEHLQKESPYNTYKYIGLPPGPIRIPSIKAIDATLSPSQHDYLFMCAKEDFSRRHNFAKTFAEHQKNAVKYRIALNRRNIYK